MTCPLFLFRIVGNAALIQLTGPKKLVSNCSRTRVCVRGEAASSSTVPTSAIIPIQHSLTPPKSSLQTPTNLRSSNKAEYPTCQTPPPPQQPQPDTVPSHYPRPLDVSPTLLPQYRTAKSINRIRNPHTSHPALPPYTSPSTPPSHTPAKIPETHPRAPLPPLPLLHQT